MRVALVRVGLFSLAILVMVCGTAVPALASGPAPVPEIDGGSIVAGLGALSAAVLIVRSRRRSK